MWYSDFSRIVTVGVLYTCVSNSLLVTKSIFLAILESNAGRKAALNVALGIKNALNGFVPVNTELQVLKCSLIVNGYFQLLVA